MKNVLKQAGFWLTTLTFAALNATTASAAIYPGNTNNGFGGPLGNGSLTVTDDGTTLSFTFNAGASNNDYLILYIDSVTGGLTTTSGVNDFQDGNRGAISAGGSIIFPSGFVGDYAISTPGAGTNSNFAGLWQLATGGNNSLGFVSSAGIGGTQSSTTFSIPVASIGLTPNSGQSFNFVATYASGSGFLSNEAIGTINPTGSPGFDPGTLTFTSGNSYTIVPEPSSIALLGLGAIGLLRKRK